MESQNESEKRSQKKVNRSAWTRIEKNRKYEQLVDVLSDLLDHPRLSISQQDVYLEL